MSDGACACMHGRAAARCIGCSPAEKAVSNGAYLVQASAPTSGSVAVLLASQRILNATDLTRSSSSGTRNDMLRCLSDNEILAGSCTDAITV